MMATPESPPGIVLSTPEDENIEAAIQRLKAIVTDILHEAEETPIEQCYADIERITQLVREDSPFLDGPDAVQQQAPPTQHRPSVSSRAVLLIQRTARAGRVRQRLGLQRAAALEAARAASPASSVARSPSRGAVSGDSTAVAASYMMQQAATIERLRTELAALQKHCGRSAERSASPPMAAAPRRSGSGSSPSSSPTDLRGDVVFTRSTSQPSSPPQPGAAVGSIGSAFHDVQLARHPLTAQHSRSRSPLEEMLFPHRVPPPRIGAALAGCARSSSKEKRTAAAAPRQLQRKTSAALMTEKASAAFAEERRFHARHRSPPGPERRTRSPPPASPPGRPAAHQSPAKAPAHQSPATSPSKAPVKGYTYSTISSNSVHGGVSGGGGGAGGVGGSGVGHTAMPRMSLSPTVTRRFNSSGLNASGSSSSYAGRKSPAVPRLQTSVSVRGQPSHSSGGVVPPSPKYPK